MRGPDLRPISPGRVAVQTQYAREKTPKILNALPGDPQRITAQTNAIFGRFDLAFAMDTNTRVVRDAAISATAVVLGKKIYGPAPADFAFGPTQALEHRNVVCDPELLGWMCVIRGIERNPQISSNSVALIVDSHLGDIAAMNDRSKAILDGFLLPSRFTLLYASADAGRENVLNAMISAADKYSSSLLDQIAEYDEWGHQSQPLTHGYAEYVRMWEYGG